MKQLEEKFNGRGEVKGYVFEQIEKSPFAYLYKVSHEEGGTEHYEVFEHRDNVQFDCVSYPGKSSFGLWAWTYHTLERAKSKFDSINSPKKQKSAL